MEGSFLTVPASTTGLPVSPCQQKRTEGVLGPPTMRLLAPIKR